MNSDCRPTLLCCLQVAAMTAGLANLSQSPGGVWGCARQGTGRGEGGVGSQRMWHVGELEFEALMRMLDNKVCTLLCMCVLCILPSWILGTVSCYISCNFSA